MFNTANTANAKKNLSNVARYFVAHKQDNNEFLFAAQYVVEILKNNADGLTEKTFLRCWNNVKEEIHHNIWDRGGKMIDSLIHILAYENRGTFTAEQIAVIVKYGWYQSTVDVGVSETGLTDLCLLFTYDRKPVVLKFA